MKRITTTAVGLAAFVVMLALGAFAAGSASAHEFIVTGPLPALVLILSDNKQVFVVETGTKAFQIECPHFTAHGILQNGSLMHGTTGKISGEYPGKCTVTGGSKATVSPVEYELNANGTVSVVNKTITITAGSPALCSVLVPPSAANSNLGEILYLNKPQDLLAHVHVAEIHSTGTNGVCGEAGVEHTKGTYTGLFLIWIDGGTIQWE